MPFLGYNRVIIVTVIVTVIVIVLGISERGQAGS